MSAALRVVTPGLQTTVQDRGRFGFQHLGVPVSGALDCVALGAANALAGNAAGAAALEVACLGPTLEACGGDVRLAIAGAAAQLEVLPHADAAGGRRIAGMRSVLLRRGEALRVGALSDGAVLYVAAEGGLDIAPVLGSASTDIRGKLGGIDGRALVGGDIVPLALNRPSERPDMQLLGLNLRAPERIRAIAGPQRDFFSDDDFAAFSAQPYVIAHDSNRMGMRLEGAPITSERGFNIVSDAIAPGSIQITGGAQPIVLLADRQTTGGYPKIGTVISADLPALGRMRCGDKVHFEWVSVEAAQQARQALIAAIEGLPKQCTPLQPHASELAARLLGCNLISGLFDAAA